MVNYSSDPGHEGIAYLTADDLVQAGLEGESLELNRVVREIRLTADAGEMLGELDSYMIEEHTGVWD